MMLLASCGASASNSLFEQYNFGVTQSRFGEQQGYVECLQSMGLVARCRDGVEYAGERFRLALIFQRQKLGEAVLYADYDEDVFRRVLASLAKQYMLVSISSEHDSKDILSYTLDPDRSDSTTRAIGEFEAKSLKEGLVTYRLYERLDRYISSGRSAAQVMARLPAGIRVAEVTVKRSASQGWLFVKFSRPGLAPKASRR
ncbi:hypothetical protein JVX91_19905 [Pseudomonas sp. PDNC002]|uniref:hypothetical protein n=1 Tax=Pseudomonas sp. PDNC002 TaxID=2811422 RepID=UPI001965D72D|nr:hypothetical protein [Pseudomonas sp. PDNC002]QRY77851.1 hypothetical protein JVX91_19905 [Pseudomonas sp. PDNC002]